MACQSAGAIARNVARLRASKELSQGALARICGIARPRISELESGNANTTVETLEMLAAALGVEVTDLLKNIPAARLAS